MVVPIPAPPLLPMVQLRPPPGECSKLDPHPEGSRLLMRSEFPLGVAEELFCQRYSAVRVYELAFQMLLWGISTWASPLKCAASMASPDAPVVKVTFDIEPFWPLTLALSSGCPAYLKEDRLINRSI